MSDDSDIEKEHAPTPQKLEQARRKGQIVRSTDLSVAASYGGFYLALAGLGAVSITSLGGHLARMLADADSYGPALFGGGARLSHLLLGLLPGIAPWLVLPMLAVVAVLAAQRAFLFVPDKIMPKLNRINPMAAAKQKFGRAGLFEFGKSTVKLIVVSVSLWRMIRNRIDDILGAQHTEATVGILMVGELLIRFVGTVVLVAVVFAGVDYGWQWFEHIRRLRMSRQELIDEMKNAEGDPHVKGQRQQRAREIALNRMMTDVPSADVVIVNPTHYAVALAWKRGSGRPPVCVAKGVDSVAARIRQVAAESGVPIRSDPPTARALYATVEIGAEIQRDHFRAVAAAIRYAEMIRRRARSRAGAR